jgi:hypothetical protein
MADTCQDCAFHEIAPFAASSGEPPEPDTHRCAYDGHTWSDANTGADPCTVDWESLALALAENHGMTMWALRGRLLADLARPQTERVAQRSQHLLHAAQRLTD